MKISPEMKKAAAWSKTWVPVLCAVLSVALTAFNMLHTERVRREQERLSALLRRSQSAPQNAREKMLADYWELAVRMEELPNC